MRSLRKRSRQKRGEAVTATVPNQSKVTYTSANVDWEAFHRQFDDALSRIRAQLGRDYPLYIGREAVPSGGPPIVDASPIDTGVMLGRFATAIPEEVGRAVAAAKAAQRDWARRPWRDRLAILRRAASLIRERKFELAAIMALEVGKSRLESMGDAEESADLIDYYGQELEDANGFVRQMAQVTAVERNTDVLRPYGVFACIAPFNFPLALSTGMSAAALMTGNAVVYKPAEDAPWTGLKLYEVYRDAGVPPGAFNYIPGTGEVTGEALWRHPGIDGVVFTGSKVSRVPWRRRGRRGRSSRAGNDCRTDASAAATSWHPRSSGCRSRPHSSSRSCSCRSWRLVRWRGSSRRSRRPTRRSTASRRASSRRGLRRSSASSTRSKRACVT